MEAKNLEQLEFSLDSVIDLSSTSPSSSSPVELRFQQSDSTHCFTFDLASAQLFKFGTVQFICNNSEEKPFSQEVNIKFESEKEEFCEEWRKDALDHQGGGSSSTVSASKSKFDEASSAKMDSHYYGQQNMRQDYVRTGNRSNFAGRVVVVDVGAGSGILSMFAAQAGAKHAVEASEMAEYARKLIAGNPLFADRITVIVRPPRSISTLLVNQRMLNRFMSPNVKMFPTVGRIHMAPFSDELLFIEKANKALFRQQDNYCGVDLTPLFGSAHQGYFSQSVVDAFDPRILVAPSMFRKRSNFDRKGSGLRTRSLACIAALFGSLAVAKARSSPGSSTDSRVDAFLSIMREFEYNQLLAQSWIGSDPCDNWRGISCMDGQIWGIKLSSMNLTGSISRRFGDLTSAYVIDLAHNMLTGTIPIELTRMNMLRSLDVSYNNLHGKIPHFEKLIPDTIGNPQILRDAPSREGNHILGWAVPVGIGLSIGILIGAGICFFRSWKRKRSARASQPEQSEMVPQPQQNVALPPSQILESENSVFSLQTLREATQDFSISIGKGGSGFVYQGKLEDGREIAVKKMVVTAGGTGCSVFDAEVRVLSRVRHRNIVSLHGYCIQGDERLLVYELMAQGSLSKHLEKGNEALKLDWSRRLVVALDVARGLEYLHTLASESQIYIHRDVKSANILLGKDLRAKIADFGYVRATTEDREPINTACVGTLGYMAPEYFDGGMLSRKADVYSFGVILLELITGKKACNKDDCNMSQDFIAMWFEKKKEDFWNSIDVDIDTEHETHQSVREVAELAGSCCSTEAEKRPEMSQIVRFLSSLIEIRDRRNQASSSGS